jgi:MscS family membrane protein
VLPEEPALNLHLTDVVLTRRPPVRLGRLALLLWVAAAAVLPGRAGAAPSVTPVPTPLDEFGRGSPRGAVMGFLAATSARDYRRAVWYLDLRRLSSAEAAEEGPLLARHLRVVLDQTLRIDPDALPDEPEGRPDPGLPPGRQLVGRIQTESGFVSIFLDRVPRDDGALIWKFSGATVARIPDLYERLGYGPVGERLPPVLVETRLLGLALWQWAGLVLLIAAALLVARLAIRPRMPLARWLFARWRVTLDERILERGTAPARFLVALVVFRAGEAVLSLPVAAQPTIRGTQRFLLVIAVTWLAFRLIEAASDITRQGLRNRQEIASLPLVDLVQRTAKIMVSVLAVLMLLQAVGVQVSAMVAAIGVGGIGLALAAQRTVENLFGGLAVIGDQPVREGDYCRFGDQEGTVERIGLWSTRIRTVDRSVVSVPNAQFFTLQIENLAKRDRILVKETLRLRCETTPDQLRWLLVQLRELLYAHPRIDPDPARVRFVGFGAQSLDVQIFAYVVTEDYNDFLAVREDLWLRVMDVVAASGTGLALPSQRNYGSDVGFDGERGRAVAAEVQRWRDEGRLPLPEFPPERVRSLAGTLQYPRAGASPSAAEAPRTDPRGGR